MVLDHYQDSLLALDTVKVTKRYRKEKQSFTQLIFSIECDVESNLLKLLHSQHIYVFLMYPRVQKCFINLSVQFCVYFLVYYTLHKS